MFNQELRALSKLRIKTKKKADDRNRFTDDPVTGVIEHRFENNCDYYSRK